ncbi:hypothetical protein V5799_014051 [Amblyomma americanum]|uniref:Innexin n=1 Tax=Amblyomma americanum TaxID=6943 RepID=A0AAQ4E457_AMBAM
MLNLLGHLSKLFKLRMVHIDGNVFGLHSGIIGAFLMAFCMLLTAIEYAGTPIECYCPTLPESVVNSFCWVDSTFSLRSLFNVSYNGSVIYPGAGPGRGDRKYRTYYQWVCFLMFAQALCFNAPRLLWKAREGGKVPAIMDALNVRSAITHDRADPRSQMVDFLVVNMNRN